MLGVVPMSDSPKRGNTAMKISSHCYITPLDESCEPDEKLLVNEDSLQVFDEDVDRSLEFHFDSVYRSPQEFTKSSYNSCIAPLIQQTIKGDSTVAVFGGPESLNMHQYLLSQVSMQGIISQAAGQLLNSVNTEDDKIGSVTFSWFKIDCGSPELLTDILKTASTSQGVVPVGKNGDANSLVLRELGRGRGMVVPGLWEVEISGGADIEAVVDHVLKIVPGVADHHMGQSHTILQLTVTNHAIAEQHEQQQQQSFSSGASVGGRSSSPLRSSASLAGAGVSDGPGVGRIAFVLLSSLEPPSSQPGRAAASSSAPAAGLTHTWVEQAKVIMQWLESRRASPPFAKSRLLLLLKDVLMQRQRATFCLMLAPTSEDHALNLKWLRLVNSFCKDHMSVVSDQHQQSHNRSNTTVATTRMGTDTASGGLGGSASRSRSATPTSVRSRLSLNTGPSSAPGSRATTPVNRHSGATGVGGHAGVRGRVQDHPVIEDFNAGRRSAQQRVAAAATVAVVTSGRGGGNANPGTVNVGDFSRAASVNLSRASSRSDTALTRINSRLQNAGRNGDNSPALGSNRGGGGGGGMTPSAATTSAAGSIGSSSPASPAAFAAAAAVQAGVVDASVLARFQETELALQMALEASRSESAALKVSCNYANDKYEEVKVQYDELVARLQEEGPFLVKRDRERLRNALKDLKDYEIYKQVMEAAMTRMQQELEMLAQENQEIKAHRASDEKAHKKQRNFSEKYTKDLVATKRQLSEAEQRIAQLQKQLKQVMKEREVAVSTLAQTKARDSMRDGQLRVQEEARSLEVMELKKKLHRMEEKCRELETDKEAMLAVSSAEADSLRAAHGKALEMLMGYQEENDVLRAATGSTNRHGGKLTGSSSGGGKRGDAAAAAAAAAAGMLSRPPNKSKTVGTGTKAGPSNRRSSTDATTHAASTHTLSSSNTGAAAFNTSGDGDDDLDGGGDGGRDGTITGDDFDSDGGFGGVDAYSSGADKAAGGGGVLKRGAASTNISKASVSFASVDDPVTPPPPPPAALDVEQT